jgi:hypothetical protein
MEYEDMDDDIMDVGDTLVEEEHIFSSGRQEPPCQNEGSMGPLHPQDLLGPPRVGEQEDMLADMATFGGPSGSSASPHCSRRSLRMVQDPAASQVKLAHAKFYNTFADDFDESDMKLEGSPAPEKLK